MTLLRGRTSFIWLGTPLLPTNPTPCMIGAKHLGLFYDLDHCGDWTWSSTILDDCALDTRQVGGNIYPI